MINQRQKTVVVIGAGFGGLWVAKELSNTNYHVILIDKNNYHTFLPLLYQVSAAEIEPEQIASPVRFIIRNTKNIRFIRGEVTAIHYANKTIECLGQHIPFDYLVVAAGSVNSYFNISGASQYSFPLKTLDDAMILRNHVLSCFERASFIDDKNQRKRLLTIVIVGGGPTGVEFAGALAELVHGPLHKDFPELHSEEISVCLIEAGDRILGIYPPILSEYAKSELIKKGVNVLTHANVGKIEATGVYLNDSTIIPTETVVWTAGVKGEMIKNDCNMKISTNGRIQVNDNLNIPEYDDVFIIGDLAQYSQEGKTLPMIAPVAIQQGKYVGRFLKLMGKNRKTKPFHYRDKGSMVTIGRNHAVTQVAGLHLKGYIAWIIWIFIHILYLIGFRNKLFVMINWVWDYIFFEKSVRLILPRCCDNPDNTTCKRRFPNKHFCH